MLWFLVQNAAPVRNFVSNWGAPIWGRVRVLKYERTKSSNLAGGTYIFGDLELMEGGKEAAVHRLHYEVGRREDTRILNRPDRALGRYPLLRRLHDAGFNDFKAFRLDEGTKSLRFPAFVRHICEHVGAFTGLISGHSELNNAVKTLVEEGHSPEDLLIVEFVDTADSNGLFRKYSAVNVDGEVIAHHVMFGNSWQVKGPSLVSPDMIAEERRFQDSNPHEQKLAKIFGLAGIEYGRVDYGLHDGRIQVWEINTNPTLLYEPHFYEPLQFPAKRWFSERLNQAFRGLDERSPGTASFIDRYRSYRDFWRAARQRQSK